MTRLCRPTIHPPLHPPGCKVLVDSPGSASLSTVDGALVAFSSALFVGSVVWVPLAYAWAIRKWRQTKDKRRKSVYLALILSAATLAVTGPHRSQRVGRWLNARRWRLWQAWMNFIAFEVISDQGGDSSSSDNTYAGAHTNNEKTVLRRDDQAILAVVPHGIFPFALAFAALPERAARAFGEFRPVVATATALFPFVRTFLGWLGAVDASREAVDCALAEGARIGLAPGGIAEMFEGYPKPLTHPDDEYAILEGRKGFIRMAIKHGVPVVPVYTFGATKMLKRVQLPGFVEQISKLLRISICVFFGRWGLPIPYRAKLLYVMGKALYPPTASQDDELFRQQVDDMHQNFCMELRRIFDRHKHAYGWEDKSLKII